MVIVTDKGGNVVNYMNAIEARARRDGLVYLLGQTEYGKERPALIAIINAQAVARIDVREYPTPQPTLQSVAVSAQ